MTPQLLTRPRSRHTGETLDAPFPPFPAAAGLTGADLMRARLTGTEHTPFVKGQRLEPAIRDALFWFDVNLSDVADVLEAHTARTTQQPATQLATAADSRQQALATNDAVGAVAWVATTLGVPERDVLAAAGIAERTFHEWKSNGRQPRLGSQGRLWRLVQITEDFTLELADPRAWLAADPGRRARLVAGDAADLLAEAVAENIDRARRQGLIQAKSAASQYAVGQENDYADEPFRGGSRPVPRRPVNERTIAPRGTTGDA